MKQGLTDVTIVLDRSGSMAFMRDSVTAGFEEFKRDQARVEGQCRTSLIQFDYSDTLARGEIETVYSRLLIQDVPSLRLEPRGWTNLYDAVGTAIQETGARYRELPESERPERVVFVIITDGADNRSREFSLVRIRELIKHQREKYNWQFVFLGTNIDAVATAVQMGIPYGGAAYYANSAAGNTNAWRGMSNSVATYRRLTEDGGSISISESDREAMNDTVVLTNSN